jgi:hypothetical protein
MKTTYQAKSRPELMRVVHFLSDIGTGPFSYILTKLTISAERKPKPSRLFGEQDAELVEDEKNTEALRLLAAALHRWKKIGTDEPVNGGDAVDWLNEWIPTVRRLLT